MAHASCPHYERRMHRGDGGSSGERLLAAVGIVAGAARMTTARVPPTARLAVTLAVPVAIGRVARAVVPGALVWIALRGIALGRIAPVTMPTALAATLVRVALGRIARTRAVVTLPVGVRLAAGQRTRLMFALARLLLAGGCRHLLAG